MSPPSFLDPYSSEYLRADLEAYLAQRCLNQPSDVIREIQNVSKLETRSVVWAGVASVIRTKNQWVVYRDAGLIPVLLEVLSTGAQQFPRDSVYFSWAAAFSCLVTITAILDAQRLVKDPIVRYEYKRCMAEIVLGSPPILLFVMALITREGHDPIRTTLGQQSEFLQKQMDNFALMMHEQALQAAHKNPLVEELQPVFGQWLNATHVTPPEQIIEYSYALTEALMEAPPNTELHHATDREPDAIVKHVLSLLIYDTRLASSIALVQSFHACCLLNGPDNSNDALVKYGYILGLFDLCVDVLDRADTMLTDQGTLFVGPNLTLTTDLFMEMHRTAWLVWSRIDIRTRGLRPLAIDAEMMVNFVMTGYSDIYNLLELDNVPDERGEEKVPWYSSILHHLALLCYTYPHVAYEVSRVIRTANTFPSTSAWSTLQRASDRGLIHAHTTCAACGRQDLALYSCATCHRLRYCSRQCQLRDWAALHNHECHKSIVSDDEWTSSTGDEKEADDKDSVTDTQEESA